MRKRLATRFVAAPPSDVFALITTPALLLEWNSAIVRVIEAPESLQSGSEWVVQMSALGRAWPSRSTVVDIDPEGGHFAYRSRTDDGNPSYWSWQVAAAPEENAVTVSCELHPATFWRRALLVKIRESQLERRGLPKSLSTLASLATTKNEP